MNEKIKKKHTVLMEGPVSGTFIGISIAKHSTKTEIGAHAIFLGQVRKDVVKDRVVANIEYTAYRSMAENAFETIRETAFKKFDMVCMHMYHSLGKVNAGEISLFVFVSCNHRAQSFEALKWIVDEIKITVPIWKKENYEDGSYTWVNAHQPPI
jgi:molybdopterin synthase catalytic subunit